MAGRPPRIRTLEEIEAKLEPCALAFLYQPEEKARAEFLSSTRAKILGKAPILFDIESGIPKKEYTETILEICLNGQDAPAFRELPEEIQAELLKIEAQETPLQFKLRRAIKFTQEPPEEKKLLESTKICINNIYNSTKYINCFYKWVLTEPQNGAPNFYSCFTSLEYSPELQRILKNQFIQNCDFVVISNIEAIPTSKSTIFLFIKKCLLETINTILDLTAKCENNSERWPFQQDIETINKNLDIIDEIAQALEAVTLEDVTARPSTKKELPLFTGAYEEVINGIHSPSVNAIATLLESDKRKEFNGQIYYTNDFCNLVLRSDGIEKLNKVPNHKIMRATLSIGFSKHGKNFFKSGEIVLPKDEFLFRMGLAPEQSKDPAYRRAFCRDLNKQLQELLHFTLEVKNDIAIAGGHIIDYCNTIGNTVTIRMGKECLNILVKHKKIAYVPSTVYANRIPDNKRLEYFLLVYLEDIYTNKYIQAREQDTLKVSTILENLNNYGVVDTENRKYKEKVIDRFIEALDYLQNVNKSIEYYFTTSPDKDAPALEGPELEKYKNKANFSKLYLWFSCKPLEEYRNEEKAKEIMAEKARRAKESQKRQERARDKKLGELEAERIDKAKAQAEVETQDEQPKAKTLDDYFRQGNQ